MKYYKILKVCSGDYLVAPEGGFHGVPAGEDIILIFNDDPLPSHCGDNTGLDANCSAGYNLHQPCPSDIGSSNIKRFILNVDEDSYLLEGCFQLEEIIAGDIVVGINWLEDTISCMETIEGECDCPECINRLRVYNGSNWVDVCNCDVNILDSTLEPVMLNTDCDLTVYNGQEWLPIKCPELACLDTLEAVDIENAPQRIVFSSTLQESICPGGDCSQLATFIAVKLKPNHKGIRLDFIAAGIYDGIDIVDGCQENVMGGIGMIGTAYNRANSRVDPGTYAYTRKAWFNPSTEDWEGLPIADFDMTFTQVYENDTTGDIVFESVNSSLADHTRVVFDDFVDLSTLDDRGNSRGYQNYENRGIPLPTPQQMYITANWDLCLERQSSCEDCEGQLESNAGLLGDITTTDFCHPMFKLLFQRPLPPVEGYPEEEVFIIRIFGHPTNEGTGFRVLNLRPALTLPEEGGV